MSFVRRTAAVACVATVLLTGLVTGLAGCSEDEPTPIMPDPSTPSPTTATSEDPPLDYTPEAWEEKTDAGAIAFVDHWVNLVNRGRLTGDSQPMTDVSTPRCKTCASYAEIMATWHAPGAEHEGGPWKVLQRSDPQWDGNGRAEIFFRVRQPKQIVDLAGPGGRSRFNGGEETYRASLRWTDDEWKMDEQEIIE